MDSSMLETFFQGFNEAGGFLPRKRRIGLEAILAIPIASMRPEDFSPGNLSLSQRASRR